jgi:BirA family biotin operon repressor/biotin-[acetyl-CoA-carboxylase] ligase
VSRFIVHRHAVLGSTMDEARALALAGASDGAVVVARRQTAGRGRQGRAWFSPEGNLHASILLRPGLPAARLTELGFVVALAVADAVDALLPGGRARLKWPNDVLVGGAKIAGILVELIEDSAAIVGVGVNLGHLPEAALYPVTSLACLGAAAGVDEILPHLLAALETRLAEWQTGGFAPVRSAWLARGPAIGETVRVRLGQQTIHGSFAGLDADGALLIATDGEPRRFAAGEVLFSAL